MGKIYAQVIGMTPLETRTKKDGSGQYEYADLTLQLYDVNGQPSTHKVFDRNTGQLLKEAPDVIVCDRIREGATSLSQQGFAVGEIVLIDIIAERSSYGRNEVRVTSVEHQQPRTQIAPH